MTVRRLSTDALFLVLVCLVLGTLVLAQTSVRAFSTAGARSGPSACLDGTTCAPRGEVLEDAAAGAPAVVAPARVARLAPPASRI